MEAKPKLNLEKDAVVDNEIVAKVGECRWIVVNCFAGKLVRRFCF